MTNLEDIDNILDSFIDDGDYEGMIDWLYGLKEKAESFFAEIQVARSEAYIYYGS